MLVKSIAPMCAVFAALATVSNAYTITFVNKCGYTVWPAVGKAPNGQPDPSVAWGTKLDSQGKASFDVDASQKGIRSWGRTGCTGDGASLKCSAGTCQGGLKCTDGGITAGVIYGEYGAADFGQYGGQRTSWDLSHVDASINVATKLESNDGQSVYCSSNNCPQNQAYDNPDDHAADRNSPRSSSYTHTFCA